MSKTKKKAPSKQRVSTFRKYRYEKGQVTVADFVEEAVKPAISDVAGARIKANAVIRPDYHDDKAYRVSGDKVQVRLEISMNGDNWEVCRQRVLDFMEDYDDAEFCDYTTGYYSWQSRDVIGGRTYLPTFSKTDEIHGMPIKSEIALNGRVDHDTAVKFFTDVLPELVADGWKMPKTKQFMFMRGWLTIDGLQEGIKKIQDDNKRRARERAKERAKEKRQQQVEQLQRLDAGNDAIIEAALKILKKRGNKITIQPKG